MPVLRLREGLPLAVLASAIAACATVEDLRERNPAHLFLHEPRDPLQVRSCVVDLLDSEASLSKLREERIEAGLSLVRPTENIGSAGILWVADFFPEQTVVYGPLPLIRHGDRLLPIIERCLRGEAGPVQAAPFSRPAPEPAPTPEATPAPAVEPAAPPAPTPSPEPEPEPEPDTASRPVAADDDRATLDGFAARIRQLEAERRRLDAAIADVYRAAGAAGISREALQQHLESEPPDSPPHR